MATHRKPRPRILSTPGPRAAVGLTTAALATVTLLSESASAAPAQPPQPSIEEVKAKVDALNHQAEVATERYNQAKEQTDRQSAAVAALLDQVAQRTQKLNDARRVLGQYAAAQYRTGGVDNTTTFLLSPDPQSFFDDSHLMHRLSGSQQQAVEDFRVQQASTTQKRMEAVRSLSALTASQAKLQQEKKDVQDKLAAAQKLLNSLTAQEKARLAALEAQREAAARKQAAEIAAKEQAARDAAAAAAAKNPSGGTTSPPGGTTGTTSSQSKADQAIAFARQQLGKPYVWGATGPNSYDCSGLTQAAWKAAGIDLPRTTWDQVNAGTRVSTSELQPGDLVFFYSDISHVGIYIGGGQMIHAPHTGTVVKIAPITEMPLYGAVRPA